MKTDLSVVLYTDDHFFSQTELFQYEMLLFQQQQIIVYCYFVALSSLHPEQKIKSKLKKNEHTAVASWTFLQLNDRNKITWSIGLFWLSF